MIPNATVDMVSVQLSVGSRQTTTKPERYETTMVSDAHWFWVRKQGKGAAHSQLPVVHASAGPLWLQDRLSWVADRSSRQCLLQDGTQGGCSYCWLHSSRISIPAKEEFAWLCSFIWFSLWHWSKLSLFSKHMKREKSSWTITHSLKVNKQFLKVVNAQQNGGERIEPSHVFYPNICAAFLIPQHNCPFAAVHELKLTLWPCQVPGLAWGPLPLMDFLGVLTMARITVASHICMY